jgi:hypothetical protein
LAHADFQILVEPLVGGIHDEVHTVRHGTRGVRLAAVLIERVFDLREPAFQQRLRSRVERRERAQYAGPALLDDELRARDEEHRRADHRHAKIAKDLSRIVHAPARTTGLRSTPISF